MAKQLFLLNSTDYLDGGNIGCDMADQGFYDSVEELEAAGAKLKPTDLMRLDEGPNSIHLLQVELGDNDVVTGIQFNRLYEPGYGFVGPGDTETTMEKMAKLGKWLPTESWELPDYVMPPFFSNTANGPPEKDDPEATYIAAIKVGQPITYKKIDPD